MPSPLPLDLHLQDYVSGRLYLSQRYMCFTSNDDGNISIILPYREVGRLFSVKVSALVLTALG